MTRPDVLMMWRMLPSVGDALEETFTVHRLYEAKDPDAFLAEVGPRILGAAVASAPVNAELLARLPNLQIVGNFGVGYDNIDVAACKARGIHVTNTPDVLNDAVAETTLALMLALCRRIPEADAYVRSGEWLTGPFPLSGELTGKTVGILGLGRIGKEIARRCQVFKMQVVYHGRHPQRFEPYPYYSSLVEMARAVDWLVVVVPGGAATAKLVNREVLDALGPEGMLVNVGRGTTVDEAALIAALQEGRLGGAALDVFEDEPRVPEALRALSNVVLAPHVGSATEKTRWMMGDLVVRNLRAHFAGDPLITPVA
jgi:lactate dehydrogenase-like 2-hydroxyacid dehydrogenase